MRTILKRGIPSLVLIAFAFSAAADDPRDRPQPYLLARDGQQCVLQESGQRIAEEERARIETAGIEVAEVRVSFLLRDDHLPERCIPESPEEFFRIHPWAAAGVKESGGAVCEACGCPETWFFCVSLTSAADLLEELGYAAVAEHERDSED